jgi:hypothetical protein
VFPNPIVRSVSAPGSTVSWPNRAVIRRNISLSFRPPIVTAIYTLSRNL